MKTLRNMKFLSLVALFVVAALTACTENEINENIDDNGTEQPVGPKAPSMLETPLTIEAIEDGVITFANVADGAVTYTIDGGEKQTIAPIQEADLMLQKVPADCKIAVTAGQKVAFYGDNATYDHKLNEVIHASSNITCTADCYVYGNIMSLVSSTGFATARELSKEYALSNLFLNNTHIRMSPDKELVVPATTLAAYSYKSMFEGCTGITVAPGLPATTLAEYCYAYMFKECTSLETATLPATTLTDYCYQGMFWGCSKLTSLTCLATDVSANGCTIIWLDGVAETGTFYKASSMTGWANGNFGVPEGWLVKDAE